MKGDIDQQLCSPEEWDIYCRLRNCWMYNVFQMTEYVELPLEIQYAIMKFEEKYSDLTAKGESEKFYNEFHTQFGKDLYGSITETFSRPQ